MVSLLEPRLRDMDIDWPNPKRRRMDIVSEDSSVLLGLCDALASYAATVPVGTNSCSVPGLGLSTMVAELGQLPEDQPAPHQAVSSSAAAERAAHSSWISHTTSAQAMGMATEPILRALTQLANAAASGAAARQQLVVECQVHAPLLRLMLGPWGQEPLVAERCCRLLHWLCARAPENREILAVHCSPGASGARSISFIDAVLGSAEAHCQRREVLAHALRALAALLPCPRVREELLRVRPRLLSCLALAGEALDAVAVRSVCRWLPGVSGQVRQARRLGKKGEDDGQQAVLAFKPVPCHDDDDVHMDDV